MPTDVLLYGGDVRLTFDEAAHSYMANGEPCPSVTQILKVIDKPALPRWAAKETAAHVEAALMACLNGRQTIDEIWVQNLCRDAKAAPWRKADDAASIGGIVHRFAEQWALGERPPPPINPQAKNAADQFVAWWESNHVEVIAAERKVYHSRDNYAGTVDLIANINGKRAIADFKTSTGIWPEYRLQLAAYAEAYNHEFPPWEPEERICLRFGKDGAFEAATYAGDWALDYRAFESALALYRWQESIKQPRKGRRAA